jgi:hypothetical protein
MGLLADIQALSADTVAYATAQGQVTAANTALATATASAAAAQTTVTAADTQLATDLGAAPYNGICVMPDPSNAGDFLVYQVSATPPGFTITPALPPT